MPPVLCVVGRDSAGVRAVVEGLVRELTAKGVRVATAVEAAEAPPSTPVERCGSYMAAGSEMTIVQAPGSLALAPSPRRRAVARRARLGDARRLRPRPRRRLPPQQLPEAGGHRADDGDELLCHKNELLAIAGDKPAGVDMPAFAVDDFPRMADLVRRRFLTQEPGEDAALFIDGVRLPLALFVRKIVASTVLGMVRPLKGVDDPKSVVVTVRAARLEARLERARTRR